MKGWRKKMIWIISLLLLLIGFWYYNFRWVEYIPIQSNYGNDRQKPWIEQKIWWEKASSKNKQCFKKSLEVHYHDYKEVGDMLYIRAYLQRDKQHISIFTQPWPSLQERNEICNPEGYIGGEPRIGFFYRYIDSPLFSGILDKLFMWNWDK